MPGALHIPRRQSPAQIDDLFAAQRAGDPIGVRIQLALAVGCCFFAGWSTSYVEWCAVPVLIVFLIRMTGQHRILEPLAFDRVLQLLLAWGTFVALSLFWSAGTNLKAWQVDILPLRFLALAVILWPCMDRRSWLILALMAGIACGQCAQFLHLATLKLGSSWMPFHRMPGRITGWWDPVSGGTVLCAALGLWLAPVIFGSGRARLYGAIGSVVTLICLGLTGTRGAWIGAFVVCWLALGIAPWHKLSRPVRTLGAVAALLVVATVAALAFGGAMMARRGQQGWTEVTNALNNHDYTTDTGLRLAMWKWAAAAAEEHPIVGVGAGGYQPWVRSQTPETAARLHAPIEAAASVHAQAHSVFFHTLATGGIIGFILVGALLQQAIVGQLRGLWWMRFAPDDVPPRDPSPIPWTDVAPALALLGLACAGLFDTITVNQQPSFLFYLLIAFCLPSRPTEVRQTT